MQLKVAYRTRVPLSLLFMVVMARTPSKLVTFWAWKRNEPQDEPGSYNNFARTAWEYARKSKGLI